jgi:hypothetical protein
MGDGSRVRDADKTTGYPLLETYELYFRDLLGMIQTALAPSADILRRTIGANGSEKATIRVLLGTMAQAAGPRFRG